MVRQPTGHRASCQSLATRTGGVRAMGVPSVRSRAYVCTLACLLCVVLSIDACGEAAGTGACRPPIDTEPCANALAAEEQRELEEFMNGGARVPRTILDIGAGHGLAGISVWAASNASLTSLDAWADANIERCFDANRQRAMLSTKHNGPAHARSIAKEKHTDAFQGAVIAHMEKQLVFDFIVLSAHGRDAHEVLLIAPIAVRLLPEGGQLMVRGYLSSELIQFAIDSFAASHDEILKRVYCGDDNACFRRENPIS